MASFTKQDYEDALYLLQQPHTIKKDNPNQWTRKQAWNILEGYVKQLEAQNETLGLLYLRR